MNRRGFLKALAALPVAVVLAPLVSRPTPRIPFRLDPRIKPGVVYILNDELGWDGPSFGPAWLDEDGTVLKIDDGGAYEATFHEWFS